jgi:hypothetical protein
MNKKEIKNAINKAAYEMAKSMGYMIDDAGDGSCVTFIKPGRGGYDAIDWHRSYHEVIVLENMAQPDTVNDAQYIEEYMKPIIEHFQSQYKK